MARKKRVVHEDPDVLVPILKDGMLHPTSVMYREVLTEGKRDEAHLKKRKDMLVQLRSATQQRAVTQKCATLALEAYETYVRQIAPNFAANIVHSPF